MLTEEQKLARQGFIGGSDAPAVCGVDPYRTAYDIYLDKIGQGKPVPETEAMYWGNTHESNIARRYSDLTGRAVSVVPTTYRYRNAAFLGCHIDRLQVHPTTQEQGCTEIKTTRARLKKGECPERYIIQLYHNLICMGATWGTVVILIQGSEMVWYDYTLTPQIEKAIITIETKFWRAVEAKDWGLFQCG